VALVPVLWALRGLRARRGALIGLAFGLVYYGIVLYWLLPFGVIAWLPLVLSQAAYAALFGAVLPLLWEEDRPLRSAAAAAALWTTVDWVRGVWPLGGFTWGTLGNTQHANHLLLPLASVTGVWGVTFVVVMVNALLLGMVSRVGEWGRRAGLGAVAAAAVLLPALVPLPRAAGPTLDVAVVQGNVDKAEAASFYLTSRRVAENHIRLHERLANDPPDLAVWPENSLDVDPTTDPALQAEVTAAIRAVGVPTLAGAVTEAPGGRFHNQVLFYSDQGAILGRYSKMHPVPFGEYVPFRPLFGWVEQLRYVPRDIAPGHEIRLFDVRGVLVGTPICFENIFPDLFRRFVSAGANFMVVTTNDSSYADSPASREHVIMSQMRAVETGRWVVQAAISGESALIDPRGRVLLHTGLFVPAILRASVPASTARTFYVRFGDWFPWACGIAVLGGSLAWMLRRRSVQNGSTPAPPAGERERERTQAPLPISGAADPKVMVVLPTYNERDTIVAVLTGVLAAGPNVHALVVDDNSPDGTGEFVAALAENEPRVRLLGRSGKLGLASAYLLGFRRALDEGFDVVVEMDADLSHRPEDLPRLLEAVTVHDMVIGSRYVHGGEVSNWSKARVTLSRAGNAYARAMLRVPVADATSGYRAYRAPALRTLLQNPIRSDGYAFQIELAYRAWRAGFDIAEVPITFREREHGRSKLSRRIVAEALLNVAAWGIRDRLRRTGKRSKA
jgi:apolipoprotein N-acyltransferase